MAAARNIQVIFKAIPEPKQHPDPNVHFSIHQSSLVLENVALAPNQLLLRNLYLSMDSYTLDALRDPAVDNFFPATPVGSPVQGFVVGEVVRSTDTRFKKGDVVSTYANWEEYTVIDSILPPGAVKYYETVLVSNPRNSLVPLSYYVGLLGVPGATAFIGIHKYAQPRVGHLGDGRPLTVYISAASGAVGQIVGQYCKALGLRVVGSSGDDAKVEFLQKELGFDAAFNYKRHGDSIVSLDRVLKENCPHGIDIYFDGVGGGPQLDAVLLRINEFGRIVMCGDLTKHEPLQNAIQVLYKRVRMEGFIVFDDWLGCAEEFVSTFVELIQEGKMKYPEHVTMGIDKAPEAFVDVLRGKHFGKKAVIKVGELC